MVIISVMLLSYMHYTFLAIDLQMLYLCIYAPQFQLKYEWKVYYKGLRIVAVAPLESQEVVGYISETISLILFLIILTHQVVTQLFFKTQLGQRSQKQIHSTAQRFSYVCCFP